MRESNCIMRLCLCACSYDLIITIIIIIIIAIIILLLLLLVSRVLVVERRISSGELSCRYVELFILLLFLSIFCSNIRHITSISTNHHPLHLLSPLLPEMHPGEHHSILQKIEKGVEMSLQRTQAWSKFNKELVNYVEKRNNLCRCSIYSLKSMIMIIIRDIIVFIIVVIVLIFITIIIIDIITFIIIDIITFIIIIRRRVHEESAEGGQIHNGEYQARCSFLIIIILLLLIIINYNNKIINNNYPNKGHW